MNFQHLLGLCLLGACTPQNKPETREVAAAIKSDSIVSQAVTPVPPNMSTAAKVEGVSYQIFAVEKPKGFGYDILIDGKRFLHQANIPAMSGIHSFRSQKEAEKVAALVVFKINHNIMPPSVTVQELDSLRISTN